MRFYHCCDACRVQAVLSAAILGFWNFLAPGEGRFMCKCVGWRSLARAASASVPCGPQIENLTCKDVTMGVNEAGTWGQVAVRV